MPIEKGLAKDISLWGPVLEEDIKKMYNGGVPPNLKQIGVSSMKNWWSLNQTLRGETFGSTDASGGNEYHDYEPNLKSSMTFPEGGAAIVECNDFDANLVHSFAVSLWTNPTPTDANMPLLYWGDDADKKLRYLYLTPEGKVGFSGGDGESTVLSSTPIQTGQWNHVVFSYIAPVAMFYVNGEKNPAHIANLESYASQVFRVGTNPSSNAFFHGILASVCVFSKHLRSLDVKHELYGGSVSNPLTSFLKSYLVLCLRFKDGYVQDISSRTHNVATSGSILSSPFLYWERDQSLPFDSYTLGSVYINHVSPYGAWTISCWVNKHDTHPTTLLDIGSLFKLFVDGSGCPMLQTAGYSTLVRSSVPIDDGEWHHVVVSKGHEEIAMFVNGVKTSSPYSQEEDHWSSWLLNVGQGSIQGEDMLFSSLSDFHGFHEMSSSCALDGSGSFFCYGIAEENKVHVFKTAPVVQLLDTLVGNKQSRFGWSCDIRKDGTMICIGAPYEDETFVDQGSVRLYSRTHDGIEMEQVLRDPSGSANAHFGSHCHIGDDGTTLSITSPGTNEVIIFEFDGSNWVYHSRIHNSAAGFGKTCFITSPLDYAIVSSNTDVYMVRLTGTNWSVVRRFFDNTESNMRFAGSLHMSRDGKTIVMGTRKDQDGTFTPAWKVYTYEETLYNYVSLYVLESKSTYTSDKFHTCFLSNESTLVMVDRHRTPPVVNIHKHSTVSDSWEQYQSFECISSAQNTMICMDSSYNTLCVDGKIALATNDLNPSHLDGYINELSIFATRLPDKDIMDRLYNKGDPRNPVEFFTNSTLKGYWRFDRVYPRDLIHDFSGYDQTMYFSNPIESHATFPTSTPRFGNLFQVMKRFDRFSLVDIEVNKKGSMSISVTALDNTVMYTQDIPSVLPFVTLSPINITGLAPDTDYIVHIECTNEESGRVGIIDIVRRTNLTPPTFDTGSLSVTPFSYGVEFSGVQTDRVGTLRFVLYADSEHTTILLDHDIPYTTANIPTSNVFSSGLDASTVYYYTITAINDGQPEEFTVIEGTFTTNIPPPYVVTKAIESPSSTSLRFYNITLDSSGTFFIELYKTVSKQDTPVTSQEISYTFGVSDPIEITFHDLDPDTYHYYSMISKNALMDRSEDEGFFSTTSPPILVSSLLVSTTDTTFSLENVQTNRSGSIEYFLYEDSSMNTLVGSVSNDSYVELTFDSATFTSLIPNAHYYYKVVATNEVGESNTFTGNEKTSPIVVISHEKYKYVDNGDVPGLYLWNKVLGNRWTARFDNDSLFVVWSSIRDDTTAYGLYGQLCRPDGTLYYHSDIVIDDDVDDDVLPTLCYMGGTKVAVTYQTRTTDKYSSTITTKIVDFSEVDFAMETLVPAIDASNVSSIAFDGNTSYAYNDVYSPLLSEDTSISMWFRTSSTKTWQTLVFCAPQNTPSTSTNSYLNVTIYRESNESRLSVWHQGSSSGNFDSGKGSRYSTLPTVDDGEWHHLVISNHITGTGVLTTTMVLDGRFQETRSLDNIGFDPSASRVVLGRFGDMGDYFEGHMSHVAIIHRRLTTDEAKHMYGGGVPTVVSDVSGLQVWWQMQSIEPDDTVLDSSVHGRHLHVSNLNQSSDVPTKPLPTVENNNALDLGTGDSIRYAYTQNADASWNSLYPHSAFMWVKMYTDKGSTLGDSYYKDIIVRGNSDGPPGIGGNGGNNCFIFRAYWTTSQSGPRFRMYVPGLPQLETRNFSYDTWYYIGYTISETTRCIYVNGQLEASDTYSSSSVNYTHNISQFWVGADSTGGNHSQFHWPGLIDELSIFDKALTALEAKEIYREGKTTDILQFSAVSNLQAWWRFETTESSGTNTIVTDVTSYQRPLYLYNASLTNVHPSRFRFVATGQVSNQHQYLVIYEIVAKDQNGNTLALSNVSNQRSLYNGNIHNIHNGNISTGGGSESWAQWSFDSGYPDTVFTFEAPESVSHFDIYLYDFAHSTQFKLQRSTGLDVWEDIHESDYTQNGSEFQTSFPKYLYSFDIPISSTTIPVSMESEFTIQIPHATSQQTSISTCKVSETSIAIVWSSIKDMRNHDLRHTTWVCGSHGQVCGRGTTSTVWYSYGYYIRFAVYDLSGNVVHPVTTIDSQENMPSMILSGLGHASPSIIKVADRFVVSWERNNSIYFRLIDASTFAFLGDRVLVESVPGTPSVSYPFPVVFTNATFTRYFITWQHNTYQDGLDSKIYVQSYDISGNSLLADPLLVSVIENDTTMPTQVLERPDGGYMFMIPSMDVDGNSTVRMISTTDQFSHQLTTSLYVSGFASQLGTAAQITETSSGMFLTLARNVHVSDPAYEIEIVNVIV